MSTTAVDQHARRLARGAGHRLEELRARESELEDEWRRLQAAGHGYAGVRASLCSGSHPDAEGAKRLREATAAQAAFLVHLDAFLRQLHSHFVDQVAGELERAGEIVTSFYGPRRLLRLRGRHRRLLRLAARYRELEGLYGTARDHQRIDVYQRFYAGVVDFSRRIRALDPTMPRSAPPSLFERSYRLRHGAVRMVGRVPALLRLVRAFVAAVWIACSTQRPSGGTPFTRRVDDLFRSWGDLQGWKVEVSGRECLPEAQQGEVTLFTPAHRHGVTDNVTFSHLALPDYLVFNAVDQLPLLPRFLKDRIAATPGLIPVGGGRGSSVERVLEALRRGVSSNVLIYPEGSVSEGFRGTRPLRENFGSGLVRRLRESGHRLRIVPLAYLDNARFLDLPARSATPEERRRRVVVVPALGPAELDSLLEVAGGLGVNHMLRMAWLEALVSDERQLFGQDRVAAIERRLDLELDGIRYWGSLEPAPLSDELHFGPAAPLEVREEPFHHSRVRVIHVPESARDEAGRIPVDELASDGSQELLIGIRPPSHIYLSVGRRRFDGDIFRRLAVKERTTVYPGIVIRFTGVPVKSLNAIRRMLDEYVGRETRTLTCANSACRVIARAANIEIDDHADMRPFLPSHVLPTRTIRKLLERGVRNHLGENVGYQIYNTDGRPLEVVLAEARGQEVRIAGDHLRFATAAAWSAVRTGAKGAFGWLRARLSTRSG
jgi:hypothetical protein